MTVVEPIADAVTGGLAARAAEPQTGVDDTGHTTERACLNCGAMLVGDYCHTCGQKGHIHRSLGAFGHDLLHGVFHFEGKIWRTLPMLAWRPGELTRRYIEGERASFVGPLPLFLFSVFLMFAVMSIATSNIKFANPNLREGIEKSLQDDLARLAALERERSQAAARGEATATLDRQIAERKGDIALARQIATDGAAAQVADGLPANLKPLRDAYLKAKDNPDLLLFKLKSNGYKFSWALIPLSLPLMWLLFPFSSRWHLYDHTVFITYSLCFMTLLVIVGSLYRMTGLPGVALLMLVPPFHMYRQLKGAYSLSSASALWRTVVLVHGASLISVLFGIGLVATGLYN